MNIILKKFFRYLVLFFIGGSLYYLIEILWRSYSHISMFILGGAVFIYCEVLNEILPWNYPLVKQAFFILAFAISGEFITGLIVNKWLDLNVWDYSNLPLNIWGQVCVPYAILFIPLCLLAIILNDYIRYFVFKEKKPHYKVF